SLQQQRSASAFADMTQLVLGISPSGSEHQTIAQIVKNQFFVCHVSDVAIVSLASSLRVLAVLNGGDPKAQCAIDWLQFFCIAGSQIIIHRYDVDQMSGQSSCNGGQSTGYSLTFAGLHLHKVTFEERMRAAKLRWVRPQFQDAPDDLG